MSRKRVPVHTKQNPKPFRKIFLYLMLFIALLFVFALGVLILQPSKWQSGDRFIVLHGNGDGSATFMVYEPQSQSAYGLRIPPNTQMDSANNLGKWRLGSLWQLYEDEDLSKGMIVDSFALTMGLPADTWAGGLGFKDRLKIVLFEFQVGKSKQIEFDPVDFGLVYEVRLVDGDQGYAVNEKVPGSIARLFASENVLGERARVGIKNFSQYSGKIESISKIVEILGTKIVTVENIEEKDVDCEVRYKSEGEQTARKLANIFSCDLYKSDELASLDISLEFGSRFWKRY